MQAQPSTNATNTLIPLPQHRPAQVLRFMPFIQQALDCYPSCINPLPNQMASTTFVARCRDAINAIQRYPQVYQAFSTDERQKITTLIVANTEKNGILIGPRESMNHYIAKPITESAKQLHQDIEIIGDDLASISMVCHLIHVGALKPQPTFITGMNFSQHVDEFRAAYPNIMFFPDPLDPTKHRIV